MADTIKRMEVIPVLFNIRSVHNVASIFRTADGAGCRGIVLVGYTPRPVDRFGRERKDFVKVSLGAEKSFVINTYARIGDAIRNLKKEGYFLVGLEQDKKSISYESFRKKFPKRKKIALVLGNEPDGISKSVIEKLDALIEIPMRGSKESLNVSVAFGIGVYELMK